jgi:hypothetical protein
VELGQLGQDRRGRLISAVKPTQPRLSADGYGVEPEAPGSGAGSDVRRRRSAPDFGPRAVLDDLMPSSPTAGRRPAAPTPRAPRYYGASATSFLFYLIR